MDAWGPQEQYNPMMLENALYDRDKQQSQHQMLQQMLTSNGGGGVLGILAAALGGYMMKKQNKKSESKLEELFQRDFDFKERQRIEDERKASEAAAAKREQDWQDFTRKEGFKSDLKSGQPTEAVRTLQALSKDPRLAQLDQQRRRAGASSVNVSPGAQATEFEKNSGKLDAQRFDEWRQQAADAQTAMNQLGPIKEILSSAETGKMNEALAIAGQYFGTEAGANLQTLRGAIQPVVLAQVKQLGSGSGITDADRKFIEAGMPGFGNDKRANDRVIAIMEKAAGSKIRLFDEAQAYVDKHRSLAGFKPTVSLRTDPTPTVNDAQQPKRLRFNPETGELE